MVLHWLSLPRVRRHIVLVVGHIMSVSLLWLETWVHLLGWAKPRTSAFVIEHFVRTSSFFNWLFCDKEMSCLINLSLYFILIISSYKSNISVKKRDFQLSSISKLLSKFIMGNKQFIGAKTLFLI